MTNHAIIAASCATLGLMSALPTSAACSLKAQSIPVTLIGLRPMVATKVNGKAGRFLLDSGSAINQISSKYAAAQKLTATQASASGPSVVRAPQFEFGGAALKDVPFAVSDRLTDVDGVIGQTFLRQNDVEYDLKGGSVKLTKAEGCEGVNLAYWAKDGEAYSEMPLEPVDKDAPFTKSEVYINGVKLRAMLVSGVAYTTITEKAANRAGIKLTDPTVKPLQQGEGPKTWIGTFAAVKIGDEEIKNAPLEIAQTGDDFYDVLIGGDFLSAHHLYVANSQQKIYFTYSGLPGVPVFKVHTPMVTVGGMNTKNEARGRLSDHYTPGAD